MKRKLKFLFRFWSKINNIIRWIPILWKDMDWDHYYIYEILKTKLKFQSQHIRQNGWHVNSKYDANRIDLCIKLIDRVQNEYYINQAIDQKYPFMTDEDVMKCIEKHDKARRLLFKVLERHIEQWWD